MNPATFSEFSDNQILHRLKRIQESHFQSQALRKGDSVKQLIENIIPKLVCIDSHDSPRLFTVYHRSIGSPPLIILRACGNIDDLRKDVDALLEDCSVHVQDHYSVVLDANNWIASIAVHNKGSADGRMINVFVWREVALYRFIGQRGYYTDATGMTVRPTSQH